METNTYTKYMFLEHMTLKFCLAFQLIIIITILISTYFKS